MQATETLVQTAPAGAVAPTDLALRGSERALAGRVSEALADLTAALDSLPLDADDTARVRLLAGILDCRLARGDLGDALGLGEELTGYVDRPGPAGAAANHARGELASALDDPEPALARFLTCGALLVDDDPELLPWRAGAALALVRLGRRAEADALAHQHLEVARASGSPHAVARALRTLATTESGGNRERLLRQARETLTGVEARRLAAQIDTDLAGLLLLPGDPAADAEALELLRGAEEYAGRQELWPLQGRVRRLLERLGESPRRIESEALAALTAAQLRVAVLAAEGLTNREIATRLVVTVKAVEWHLSHVYRKLGIRSRTRLSDSLGTGA